MRHHVRALGAAPTVVLAVAVAVVLAVGTALASTESIVAASAADDPTITVTPSQSSTVPLRVFRGQPARPGACEGLNCTDGANLAATVSTALRTPVRVTVTITSQDGLNVLPSKPQSAMVVAKHPMYPEWSIGAQTPGFHTFAYEVTAPGLDPVDVTLPYVWRAGGPHVVQGDQPLSDVMLGYNGESYYQCGVESDCEYRVSRTLSFLGSHARFGMAVDGRTACPRFHDCTAAWYDDRTGLFQVGRQDIGSITPTGGWLDVRAWYRMAYPEPGQRLAGHWSYRTKPYEELHGVGDEKLTLTRSGHFTLGFTAARHGHVTRRLAGTYSIGRNGALHLVDRKHHVRTTETLAIVTDGAGRPHAATEGVWLGVHVRPTTGKAYLDGNRLKPRS